MKKYLTLIVLFVTIFQMHSQNASKIDDLKYKCTYVITYQPDSTNVDAIESEEMLLLIGKKTSKFLSLGTYLKDSIFNNIDRENTNSSNLLGLLQSTPKTKFKEKIFKNYPNGKITTTEQVWKDFYMYEEPLQLFNWSIKEETKTISGYVCQKATTNFSGRNYTAWFTNEIPIPDGPYKFNGLPGLIIKINDSKNQYEYKLIGFEKQNSNAITMNNKNYIKTTKKEFYKLRKEFYKNIFKKLEQSGININFDNPSQKRGVLNRINKRNNPIELDIK